MREKLEERLAALQEEFTRGQSMLQEAERQRIELEATMLRIDGAITALREVLEEDAPTNGKVAEEAVQQTA